MTQIQAVNKPTIQFIAQTSAATVLRYLAKHPDVLRYLADHPKLLEEQADKMEATT